MTIEEKKAKLQDALKNKYNADTVSGYGDIVSKVEDPTTEDLQKQIEEGQGKGKKEGYSKTIFGGKKEMYDAIQRKLSRG